MHPAIDTLMHEHRAIEKVLGALDATAAEIDAGVDVPRTRVADLAEFFAGFADRCHHGKEEDLLFRRLVARGVPAEGGPIAVMLGEHEEGREHVRALAALGRGAGPLSPAEREALVAHADAYTPLLAHHIMKEDRMLYPMALSTLSPEDLDDLARRYVEFEQGVMGAGEHARLHALAERIIAAAPPSAGGSAAAACEFCCGCP
jgi:hemerythrin-like domain-containing protein